LTNLGQVNSGGAFGSVAIIIIVKTLGSQLAAAGK
jgi:hypothetical protein